jgi:hypothetical protein
LSFPTRTPSAAWSPNLLARVGARVVGEHRHPALVERFTVLEGELSAAKRRALFAKERALPSSRMYGTTGGMRATETPACAWK